MRFRGTLAARVSLLAAVAVGLSVALVASIAYVSVQHQLMASFDDSLQERAEGLAGFGPEVIVGQQLPEWLLGAADVRISLLLADGRSVRPPDLDALPDPVGGIQPTATEIAVARGTEPSSIRTVRTADGAYRVCVVPGKETGTAVMLAQSLRPTQDTLGKLGVLLFLGGAVGVLAAALAGWAVARNGLRPVRLLSDAAEEIARTEDLTPIKVEGNDEIARLATSFNAMLAALSASRDRQRQLVGDAGHELRTPLTSLRTNLDLLAQADQRGGLSSEQRTELMDDVLFQIDELTTLIGDLTELARDEPIPAQLEPVDLADVVARAVDRVRRRALDVTFEVALTPSWVTGEPASLERAIINLLDNAVKWSPPDGTVTVTLRSGTLYVADEGPGISEDDLPHVFERFYRSTESRTMPGSGLGLSIVRRIAERHGGLVQAAHAPEGGAAFWFRLPLGPPPRPAHGSGSDGSEVTEGSQRPLRSDSASVDTLET